MRLENINKIKLGDVLAKTIFDSDGRILLKSGIKLTQSYINALLNLGVLFIYVEDERLEDVVVGDSEVQELKQNLLRNISKISKNIGTRNDKDFRSCINAVEHLVERIIEVEDINKSLYDIQTYDNYTYFHCIDTGIMAVFLGMSMGFDAYKLNCLGIGGILHDIGKIKVPSRIINKKGALTDAEFKEIKKHPIYGGDILKQKYYVPEEAIRAVYEHHERVDGKGYPFGLKGTQISKFGKIVCVCDVYDAVSNDRSYRSKLNERDAYELILAGSGTSFDEEVVLKFKETFFIYPLGASVKLSNGMSGYVIKQNKGFPDRPVVRVFGDKENDTRFCEIDLIRELNITIECIN